ncbi:MAG TPA: hypothetical protein VKN82_05680 [Desulfohalobiaceae bacterium]|nr:hypothetical protein [Desulfohalobiaceae bacterium]
MIQAKVWFRCAAVHDPVSPVVIRPAILGWQAKERNVDLTISKSFKGDELVRHMRGWFTVNVDDAINFIQQYGYLKLKDSHELIVELEDEEKYGQLTEALQENFQGQLNVEKI